MWLCLAGVLILPSVVKADDTNINISGTVVASACTVDTDTVNKTVEFAPVQKKVLSNAGDGGAWSDFDLLVNNCPLGTTAVTAKLTGTVDTQDATAWKNTGTSSNVALRIASRDHATVYSNNSTMKVNVDTNTHSSTFPLSARIFTPQGSVVAGTFISVMNVDFTYQ
jgi:minor fimbrial subunit